MRNLAKRITALEKARGLQQVAKPTKRIVPEWLLNAWHEDTGLPFDTDERAMESIVRMQEPDFVPNPVQAPTQLDEIAEVAPRDVPGGGQQR